MLRRIRQRLLDWLFPQGLHSQERTNPLEHSEHCQVVGRLLDQCPSLKLYPELIRFMVHGIGGINGIYEFTHVATGRWIWTDGRWVHESLQKARPRLVK